ncbi:hypothetical protein BJ912DRAFT_595088 [Pholiota molesta]|nr:hypothetical protein BJ912DRAFT_595088 [Pholiota molesta]
MMSPVSPDSFQPLQLKGEIMDLEFTIDTDHRKRRRNRTTQSCLNCHTSKRKCDRKRPCQRCIQLGLTGLCVYEIDDPALRDDPSVDESTRLRNRIAELESLVRELRGAPFFVNLIRILSPFLTHRVFPGKPHPRWADTSFRDGDPNEKWHSRATKCVPLQKRNGSTNGSGQPGQPPTDELLRNGRAVHSLLSPIKTEPVTEANAHLYRFSASPAPSMRYHTFQADVRSDSSSSFENDQRPAGYNPVNGSAGGGMPYPTSANGNGYSNGNGGPNGSAPSSYSDGGGGGNYPLSGSDDGNTYNEHYSANGSSPPMNYNCPCRTTQALGVAYMNLSQTLQNSLNTLRHFQHHPSNTHCAVFRKVVELNNTLHSGTDSPGLVAPTYDSGPPSDNEIMTPLSASSGHASFHTGSPGVSPQEWNHMAAAGFNPYFPAPEHHGVYNVNHVMS